MARTKKQEPKQEKQEKQEKQDKQDAVVTRAEKKDAARNLIKEVLSMQPLKHNDLLDEAAKLYSQRYGADTDNPNDVKGRIGSVLDIMKKESEVAIDGGVYALKARLPMPEPIAKKAEKSVKKAVKKSVKAEETQAKSTEEKTEEKPEKKAVKRTAKKAEIKKEILTPPTAKEEKEKVEPLPPPPIQPIAPVVPTSPETAPEPTPEKTEKPKRATRKKAEQKTDEAPQEKPVKKTVKKTAKKAETESNPALVITAEEKAEAKEEIKTETQAGVNSVPIVEEKEQVKEVKTQIKNPPVVKQKAELAPKAEVMDMSFLFGAVKPVKTEAKPQEKSVQKTEDKPTEKTEEKPVQKTEQKEDKKPESKTEQKPQNQMQKEPQKQVKPRVIKTVKTALQKPMSADEKLRDNFLKKLRSLGGDYFEYYSVYLLEKYSRKNGRRLESLKISGGDRDGGIDGEIELTDRLGFRETIYIQSKNWDPDRGNERLWVVGETLLQQFIGACACKQAKDGKQHTRGIFITTSNFTPDAKRILEDMADKVVGYDSNDLFETAKECQFGLLYENGNWKIDEKLLSGTKAFFNM